MQFTKKLGHNSDVDLYGSEDEMFISKINDKVKLVGTTLCCLPHTDAGGYGPKVEGFFLISKSSLVLIFA